MFDVQGHGTRFTRSGVPEQQDRLFRVSVSLVSFSGTIAGKAFHDGAGKKSNSPIEGLRVCGELYR
jgi:hypothetical protein